MTVAMIPNSQQQNEGNNRGNQQEGGTHQVAPPVASPATAPSTTIQVGGANENPETTANIVNSLPSEEGGSNVGGGQVQVNAVTDLSSSSSSASMSTEPDFPHSALARLDEMIHRERWVVPVLPECELEVLLEASISLASKGLDTRSEACQRFFREGLTTSFTKILTDEAVNSWKYEIQKCILNNCEKLIELVVLKLPHDWFPLLDLLAMLFNPNCKFHVFNNNKSSESVPHRHKTQQHHSLPQQQQQQHSIDQQDKQQSPPQQSPENENNTEANPQSPLSSGSSSSPSSSSRPLPPGDTPPVQERIYALPQDLRHPRGWLVDLINYFGRLGGFDRLLDRFHSGQNLSVPIMCSLLRPFGFCFEYLTATTIETYFMPIIDMVPGFLENLTDDELKKEAKIETKNDALSTIIKAIKALATRIPSRQDTAKNLEIFRLKMILRLLQMSSFNGKMNALNEVNKVISNVNYPVHRQAPVSSIDGHDDEDWLTAHRFAEWIKENRVLQIVLRDSLHQPQYVEKLEKIIRFVIKEKVLTLSDLDDIWLAQQGKHEAIVKNVHDLLAKLAWDFSPEQLDHLFEKFQQSWREASKKQREKLMELIRRLAEDDKDGDMAHKVLTLLWSLARSSDVTTEIMDQALAAHVKILDYSCSQDRHNQKRTWLDMCVQELKNDKWVLPALKQIREICCSFSEAPPNYPQPHGPHVCYRHDVISKLQNQHSLVVLVTENLTAYMKQIRIVAEDNPGINPMTIVPDGRYNHVLQVQDRLSFLRFLLKDGQLWLCAPQAKQIWHCLAENAVFTVDREACFKWFSKLMGEEPDLDPDINREFFENNILELDPHLLTEHGIRCFDRFFKAVNFKEKKLVLKRRAYLVEDLDLIGVSYLWKVLLCGTDEMANRSIELLKEIYTNLGPRLLSVQHHIHDDFINNCITRLRAMFSNVSCLNGRENPIAPLDETIRMCRLLKVLFEYVLEYDGEFGDERSILPLARSWRGKQMSVIVRFPSQTRQPEEVELWTHTNDTVGSLRRQLMQRLKAAPPNVRVEMYLNSEIMDPALDGRVIAHVPLRDKDVLTGKLAQIGSNLPSSPDSSSDSSPGSPQHPYDGGPSNEAENILPGVLLARNHANCNFLIEIADLGCRFQMTALREAARDVLYVIPPDQFTISKLSSVCAEHSNSTDAHVLPPLEEIFFFSSPSTVLYNLQVLYSTLMPANNPLNDKTVEFQYNFIRSGGVKLVIDMLTRNKFLTKADVDTKRAAMLLIVKISKLVFTTVGYAFTGLLQQGSATANGANADDNSTTTSIQNRTKVQLEVLQQALPHIPSSVGDCIVKSVAMTLSKTLHHNITATSTAWTHFMSGVVPDLSVVNALLSIIWSCSTGKPKLMALSLDQIQLSVSKSASSPPLAGGSKHAIDPIDVQLSNESLETLAVVLMLCPYVLEKLSQDAQFQQLIVSLMVSSCDRAIRQCAVDQILLMATKCSSSSSTLVTFIGMFFNMLSCPEKLQVNQPNASYTKEYFQLLCGLVSCACASGIGVSDVEGLLNNEVQWLKTVSANVKANTTAACAPPSTSGSSTVVTPSGSASSGGPVDPTLLEGHLCVTRELLSFLTPLQKYHIGGDPTKGICLIREIIEDFIFPFSKVYLKLEHSSVIPAEQVNPVCSTQSTVIAAYDLLVTLCTNCAANLTLVAEMLTRMFYSENEEPLTEWDYLPAVGPRPPKGFVGLKNAGATCYMNSVLQQLYMIRRVKEGVLGVEGAAVDPDEDFSGEERIEPESTADVNEEDLSSSISSGDGSRKEYDIGILKQVQAIFAHLSCSKLQYYVPRGLWKHFKLQGRPVNLREQHDACEFYTLLVESINEALKALGYPEFLDSYLGGSLSDQMICKTCPHRYLHEQKFKAINVEIRNYTNLHDSLEQYVKGDLLEGDNAYQCEKCDKKVDTVKRTCFKKLPPILTLELKRFEYDYERGTPIKFNDYFEFPRELDVEPYTAWGLARNGETIAYDEADLETDSNSSSKYHITGIVVHSGQASGGHYYSYIRHRVGREIKWYKFDDGEVTECRMEDDEELKNQCFGGEYMSEQVFDNMMKRVSYRRQKRWWNAFLLFYTREDIDRDELAAAMSNLSLSDRKLKMPVAMERSVVRQNVRFMHSRSQFSLEYFQFIKKLLVANHDLLQRPLQERTSEDEQIGLVSTQLASKFLFMVCLHTKKVLRGPPQEWYDAFQVHLRSSAKSRIWFVRNILFGSFPFSEYLLECPLSDVRLVFSKIIVAVAHSTRTDPPVPNISFSHPIPNHNWTSLSDQILAAVLLLNNRELSDHYRQLTQYFHLFNMYAALGLAEKRQLLKLNVAESLMGVAVEEDGPGGSVIKYPCVELSKLYQVVSQLIRCCDLTSRCQSSVQGRPPLDNPHGDHSCTEPLMQVQQRVADILFNKPTYIKKVIEEAHSSEETVKLLKYCCWENPTFSSTVLAELLGQVSYAFTYEMRPFIDLLLHMMTLEDSWQEHRIHNTLKGIPDEREGLLDIVTRTKVHCQKRAYQCVKCVVTLFSTCLTASAMLHNNIELKRRFHDCVDWLNEELNRRSFAVANQVYYNNWSPPAPSNETSNGYYLERSASARLTLDKALELCPDEEGEEETDDNSSQSSSAPAVCQPKQQHFVKQGDNNRGTYVTARHQPTVAALEDIQQQGTSTATSTSISVMSSTSIAEATVDATTNSNTTTNPGDDSGIGTSSSVSVDEVEKTTTTAATTDYNKVPTTGTTTSNNNNTKDSADQ